MSKTEILVQLKRSRRIRKLKKILGQQKNMQELQSTEPVFVDLLRAQETISRLEESILGSINLYKYGLLVSSLVLNGKKGRQS
jgi:hypothetical protein